MIKTSLFAFCALTPFGLAPAFADTPPTTASIKETCKISLKGQHLKGPAKHEAVMQCAHASTDWPVARAAECQSKATEKGLVAPKLDKFIAKCEVK